MSTEPRVTYACPVCLKKYSSAEVQVAGADRCCKTVQCGGLIDSISYSCINCSAPFDLKDEDIPHQNDAYVRRLTCYGCRPTFLDLVPDALLARVKDALFREALDEMEKGIKADPKALAALLSVRVPCKVDLISLKTQFIGSSTPDGTFIGPLGFWNGIMMRLFGRRVAGKWKDTRNPATGAQSLELVGVMCYEQALKNQKEQRKK